MMTQLSLSRKVNQAVIIGDGLVEVIVQEIRHDRVRLIFRAPKELSVDRQEIRQRKDKERINQQE